MKTIQDPVTGALAILPDDSAQIEVLRRDVRELSTKLADLTRRMERFEAQER